MRWPGWVSLALVTGGLVVAEPPGPPPVVQQARRQHPLGPAVPAVGHDPRFDRGGAGAGVVERAGALFTVALAVSGGGSAVPALVHDLVGLGTGVHAVERARISLEERLLGILRQGDGGER